jgi:3-methylfumaryl-CoA hydratase
MSGSESLDAEALRGWIGRTEAARDAITPRLLREFRATLYDDDDAAISPAIHWCLAPPAAPTASLGPDGHPARGGFLPPVPLPRRMWAGSTLTFHDPLRLGDQVERRSRIADVAVKRGRTGILCFVTIEHEFTTDRGLATTERQDIVYREMQAGQAAPAAKADPPRPQWQRDVSADPVLLFRYSALTFNSHRIHYDRSYATQVEGYPGLVVHGPLQATLLLDFAASLNGAAPRQFHFRGLQPLFDFEPFRLCAREQDGGLHLWTETADQSRRMQATASW